MFYSTMKRCNTYFILRCWGCIFKSLWVCIKHVHMLVNKKKRKGRRKMRKRWKRRRKREKRKERGILTNFNWMRITIVCVKLKASQRGYHRSLGLAVLRISTVVKTKEYRYIYLLNPKPVPYRHLVVGSGSVISDESRLIDSLSFLDIIDPSGFYHSFFLSSAVLA